MTTGKLWKIKLETRPVDLDGKTFPLEHGKGEFKEFAEIALIKGQLDTSSEFRTKLHRYRLAKILKKSKGEYAFKQEEIALLQTLFVAYYNVEMAGALNDILEEADPDLKKE